MRHSGIAGDLKNSLRYALMMHERHQMQQLDGTRGELAEADLPRCMQRHSIVVYLFNPPLTEQPFTCCQK